MGMVTAIVLGSCLELCSVSSLMRSVLTDEPTLERLTISPGVTRLLISVVNIGVWEVAGLVVFSTGSSRFPSLCRSEVTAVGGDTDVPGAQSRVGRELGGEMELRIFGSVCVFECSGVRIVLKT